MFLRSLGCVAIIGLLGWSTPVHTAEPVLLQYKLVKGDKLIYKTVQESKHSQTFLNVKIDTVATHEAMILRNVDAVDAAGTATIKSKAERRKLKAGEFVFDSKSTDRDTTSVVGTAVTPLLERLTGSEYEVLVSPRGAVVDVKGYFEQISDLVKEIPVAQQTLGAGAGKAGAQIAEQDAFIVFSDKPVSPGDRWEVPLDVDLTGVGKLKGKVVYVYEADDKVGDRKTVRIGVAPDVSLEFKVDTDIVKINGTLSTGTVTGNVQFDPEAGRVLNSKRSISVSGRVTVDVDGMTFPVDTQMEESTRTELLEKLPD